jgi:hypothetical protein
MIPPLFDTDFTSTYIKSFLYIDGHVMRFAEGNVCVWVVFLH